MLKDRKVLLEREISKARESAANMYLDIVLSSEGDLTSKVNQDMKKHIADLEFDLNMINQLLKKGHE